MQNSIVFGLDAGNSEATGVLATGKQHIRTLPSAIGAGSLSQLMRIRGGAGQQHRLAPNEHVLEIDGSSSFVGELALEQSATASSARGDVTRGDGISLHEATAIDDYASEAERRIARAKDVDTHWSQVPDEHIARHDTVFSFLDIKGHVYYAPAFMSWLVRTGYGTPSNSVDSAQYAFNPWGKHEGGARRLPHDMFTAEQCACIARQPRRLVIFDCVD